MKIPDEAEAYIYDATEAGHLLLGRMGDDQPAFYAIRAEPDEGVAIETPGMVLLSAWLDNRERPFWLTPHRRPKVLDLGRDWFVDVSLGADAPAFNRPQDGILLRLGRQFFLRLHNDLYLRLSDGRILDVPPDLGIPAAYWSRFAIRLKQAGNEVGGVEVFRWPRE